MTAPLITHLKLPFRFDVARLRHDLNTVASTQWKPQVYTMNYEGDWQSIALYANGGAADTFAYGQASSDFGETEIVKHCPYFREVVATIEAPLISVRLLKLGAGAVIKPHRDFCLGYEDNNFRLHIPIVTNPAVSFILEGERLPMQAGECWYTNVNFTHSVTNRSAQDRVHLVIDAERNAWSDELFFSLAPRGSFGLRTLAEEAQQQRQVIAELKRQNKPELTDLIHKLEAELLSQQAKKE